MFPVPAARLYVKLAAPGPVCENAVTVLNPAGAIVPIDAPFRFVRAFVVVVVITGVKARPPSSTPIAACLLGSWEFSKTKLISLT